MKCPFCLKEETKVVDSRETPDLSETRRRRECLNCEKRFTTYERVESADIILVKKNESREAFDREKLKAGIMRACEKRPVPLDKIERAIDEIEVRLRKMDGEIPTSKVGELVMRKLKTLDKIAYIRFASVYRDFSDVRDFEKELVLIKK
ncbi:transcriptional regulator NrdR [Nanoarchaeota archaeon]